MLKLSNNSIITQKDSAEMPANDPLNRKPLLNYRSPSISRSLVKNSEDSSMKERDDEGEPPLKKNKFVKKSEFISQSNYASKRKYTSVRRPPSNRFNAQGPSGSQFPIFNGHQQSFYPLQNSPNPNNFIPQINGQHRQCYPPRNSTHMNRHMNLPGLCQFNPPMFNQAPPHPHVPFQTACQQLPRYPPQNSPNPNNLIPQINGQQLPRYPPQNYTSRNQFRPQINGQHRQCYPPQNFTHMNCPGLCQFNPPMFNQAPPHQHVPFQTTFQQPQFNFGNLPNFF